ncbi:hypothetical protein Cni_G24158 [Canna indica]|uniref:non-specific serine/threonine protein kinase n=1 Tax=Canna indica TaxID=4628 RepID=A0AAQ3L1X8_9LILI|nr:hypothetical protein Cni_G24158 [Canna indica]
MCTKVNKNSVDADTINSHTVDADTQVNKNLFPVSRFHCSPDGILRHLNHRSPSLTRSTDPTSNLSLNTRASSALYLLHCTDTKTSWFRICEADSMPPIFLQIIFCLLFFFLGGQKLAASSSNDDFVFNGFRGANLDLDGSATITTDGLLQLTNNAKQMRGHALQPSPLHFRNPPNVTIFSFSTTFVFGSRLQDVGVGGNGLAFVIAGSKNFSKATGSQFLGLFNSTQNGKSSNHVFAIELDTIFNPEFNEENDNHVGIDINSLISNASFPAGYYADDTGLFNNLSLIDTQAMQVWVDYDGRETRLNVTLAPVPMAKPRRPLLSAIVDLSTVFLDPMYVGFSSSTGPFLTAHYVLGWSFRMNGTARDLDYKLLPSLPRIESKAKSKVLEISLPIASAGLVTIILMAIVFTVRQRMKYAELLEDWEVEFGPHRFSYKDLFKATKGFRDKDQLLGKGGFGWVYKGVLPTSEMEVAVKKVSHESRQGMREFIAEIVSIGRLRHRNLVQLLGYCRRKGELLLVYDYMPNGSLDKFLYDQSEHPLDWATRFRIIKGVASGLLYLHDDWEQVVIHRDIKASNVLLDSELNGRLGDFGLARLYDHGTDPQTTHVVGTMGYLAPELVRTGKATTMTDVFAFGTFVLEVACGRRPVDWVADVEQLVLLDWVLENWRKGSLLATRDPRLGEEYVAEEVELVLKLGLMCSHPLPAARPNMRLVVQYLEGDLPLPDLSATFLSFRTIGMLDSKSFDDYVVAYPSSLSSSMTTASSISAGR